MTQLAEQMTMLCGALAACEEQAVRALPGMEWRELDEIATLQMRAEGHLAGIGAALYRAVAKTLLPTESYDLTSLDLGGAAR